MSEKTRIVGFSCLNYYTPPPAQQYNQKYVFKLVTLYLILHIMKQIPQLQNACLKCGQNSNCNYQNYTTG